MNTSSTSRLSDDVLDQNNPRASRPQKMHNILDPLKDLSASMSTKLRKDRACDACRRRKTKCDGPWTEDGICSNCAHGNKLCTYVEMSKPRGPPKAYVTGLENKVEKLELLLNQLRPDEDFTDELGPPVIRDSWKVQSNAYKISSKYKSRAYQHVNLAPTSPNTMHITPQLPVNNAVRRTTHLMFKSRSRMRQSSSSRNSRTSNEDSSSAHASPSTTDSDDLIEGSIDGRERFVLEAEAGPLGEDNSIRFHGRSSTVGLVETTRKFKHIHLREILKHSSSEADQVLPDNEQITTRRQEFWRPPKWELVYEGHHTESPEVLPSVLESFPPADLSRTLIDLYFTHTNIYFPLLHRPTFDRQWRDGLYRRDIWYTCVCLTMFAVASRWCDDPRVLPADARASPGKLNWKKAGLDYFWIGVGIHGFRRSLFYPATLFEIQTFTLMAMYMRGMDSYPAAWTMVSVGIRKAQDVGAHRKKIYRGSPNAGDELWKRAFWLLIVFDRVGGASLGRACGVAEEDFDIDLPLEVDDEYWELKDPAKAFKQPLGVPSSISAFNQYVKLTQIVSFTMKTVYAINKAKLFCSSVLKDWQGEVMKQLSAALAEWIEGLPDHLRWSDKMTNPIFASQAAMIQSSYHLTEMLIYRLFIPSPSISLSSTAPNGNPYPQPSSITASYPALAICTNAARICARIIEVQLLEGISNVPSVINVCQISAGLLSLIVWDLKAQQKLQDLGGVVDVKPPLSRRIDELLADIDIFVRALEWTRNRWEVVDSFLDQLRESLPTNNGNNAVAPPQLSSIRTRQKNYQQDVLHATNAPPDPQRARSIARTARFKPSSQSPTRHLTSMGNPYPAIQPLAASTHSDNKSIYPTPPYSSNLVPSRLYSRSSECELSHSWNPTLANLQPSHNLHDYSTQQHLPPLPMTRARTMSAAAAVPVSWRNEIAERTNVSPMRRTSYPAISNIRAEFETGQEGRQTSKQVKGFETDVGTYEYVFSVGPQERVVEDSKFGSQSLSSYDRKGPRSLWNGQPRDTSVYDDRFTSQFIPSSARAETPHATRLTNLGPTSYFGFGQSHTSLIYDS